MNVPDVGCIAFVEQLSNTDVTTQEMKQENPNALSVVSIHFNTSAFKSLFTF